VCNVCVMGVNCVCEVCVVCVCDVFLCGEFGVYV